MKRDVMTTTDAGLQRLQFRCLEDGHLLEEARKPTGPLAVRQSTWCVLHDSPAVTAGAVDPCESGVKQAT